MSDHQTLPDLGTSLVRLPTGTGRADSTLHRLIVADKPFYVLRQRGRFVDMAYDHGRLLAHEIEEGAFPEILSTIARGTDLGDPLKSGVATALFRGLSNRIVESVGSEFRDAIGAMADGYRDGLPTPTFSRQQVIDALVAIELDNLAEGIQHRLALPSAPARIAAIADAIDLCLPHANPDVRALLTGPADVAGQHLAAALASLAHQNHPNRHCLHRISACPANRLRMDAICMRATWMPTCTTGTSPPPSF